MWIRSSIRLEGRFTGIAPSGTGNVQKIRHRGPDWSGIFCDEKAILSHERLSIVDPQSGGQPLYSKDGNLVLAVNGEIYNHMDIRNQMNGSYEFLTKSDCEVILALYKQKELILLMI